MKHTFFILITLFLISCKEEKKTVPVIEQQEITLEETHKTIDEVIALNNGKLWLANPETTEGINKMKKRMAAFTEKENMEAYAILKEALEEDFTGLFQKCTMKGDAHHQLHNYLFPFIDLFDGLVSTDLETCKKSFKELNIHLNTYSNYFE